MKFGEMLYQLKAGPEFVVKRAGVITCNVQAAARGWTFGTERCNDNVASGLDGMRHLAHVRSAFLEFGQEVEHRPVMPNVVQMPREGNRRNVTARPVNRVGNITKSLFSRVQADQGNIQNGKIAIPVGQQVVD
jgi:hypothetical protein